MKIAITGTHSSGKTTLAMLASERLGLTYIRGDTVRDIMAEYYQGRSLESLSPPEHWELEQLVLQSRIKTEQAHESFVSDGCTLNSVAYLKAWNGINTTRQEGYDRFYKTAINNAFTYDLILYLPPEIPLVDDGLRPMSQEFRMKVDDLLLHLLKDYQYVKVTGNLEERLRQVSELWEGHRP